MQNLSFYRFFPMAEARPLGEWRSQLLRLCGDLSLKGTILIADEGVNGMLSGEPAAIDAFEAFGRNELGIEAKVFKRTNVTDHTFRRLFVKIKKEIIPVGDPTLKPYERTAKRLSAAELKQWLDEGRDMVLLDTRNDYEVEAGTFRGAIDLKLSHSRQFAERVKANAAGWKDRPVVTFCTGGIRCEKASAVLLGEGLTDVYQLDGGILRYFLDQGSDHFDGRCFVFDERRTIECSTSPKTAVIAPSIGRRSRNDESE